MSSTDDIVFTYVTSHKQFSVVDPVNGLYKLLCIDTGATKPLVNDFSLLSGNMLQVHKTISGVDDKKNVKKELVAIAQGDLEIEVMYENRSTKLTLEGALFVPNVPQV